MATIVTRLLCLAALALVPSAAGAAVVVVPELAYVAGGDVWVANADGSDARRLTTNASATWVGWSPDGTRIAFLTRADTVALYVVEPDGSGLRRLTTSPLVVPFGLEPVWSPDGTVLALVTWETQQASSDIWTFAVDGGGSRRVTADGLNEDSVQWASPETIVYGTYDSAPAVRAVSATTGASRLVVRGSLPALSPDRTRLAYVAGVEMPTVHVARVSGAEARALPLAGVIPVARPAWSPDGTSLAVVGRIRTFLTGRYAPPYYSHLWLVDGASGSARRVTGYPGDTTVPNFGGKAPVWWPGGQRLYLHGDGAAGAGLNVVGSDGRCLQREASLLPDDPTSLDWRPGATPAATPLRCVDLWTRASVAASEVPRGQPVRVTVTVRNVGNVAAPAARLVLSPVVGGRVGNFATTRGTCSASVCELGAVAAGTEARVTLTLVTDRPRAVGVRVTVISDGERDVRSWNDEASIAAAVSVCSIVGTWGNDVLLGTRRADHICGRPGSDRIDGASGNDRLEAGSGADTVTGGSGRDAVFGWDGPDVILVRDGQRDTVECGAQRDTVVADRLDRVARDCERVVRR
jgi:RTX calcium-binding nonapeptide repeat (4 copies)/WD40-like Beta Propeller Repeat